MMQITFQNGYYFYVFVDTISRIAEEVAFFADKEGNKVYMDVLDPSRIMLMRLQIKGRNPATSFLSNMRSGAVKVKIDKSGKYGINVSDLKNLIKCGKTDKSILTLTFPDKVGADEKPIKIKKHSMSNSMKVTKTISTFEIDAPMVSIDNLANLEYLVCAVMYKEQWEHILNETEEYSNTLNIHAKEDQIVFKEVGYIGEMNLSFDKSEIYSYKCDEPSTVVIANTSLKGLKTVMSAIPERNKISVFVKQEHPFKISITFPNISSELVMYIAPKVEEVEMEEDMEVEEES